MKKLTRLLILTGAIVLSIYLAKSIGVIGYIIAAVLCFIVIVSSDPKRKKGGNGGRAKRSGSSDFRDKNDEFCSLNDIAKAYSNTNIDLGCGGTLVTNTKFTNGDKSCTFTVKCQIYYNNANDVERDLINQAANDAAVEIQQSILNSACQVTAKTVRVNIA